MKNTLIITFLVLFKFSLAIIDYCSICENGTHTMCRYKGRAPDCPGYRRPELTAADKKYILDIHNDIRNHVASGLEARGAIGSQPPAADMLALEWDNELAEIAQRWADQCIRSNDPKQNDACKRTERFDLGQNVITAITDEPAVPELSVLIFNWYQQVVNVVPSDIAQFLGVVKGKYMIGQYTQLVWSETRYVGCGFISFTENYDIGKYHHRLVCNYGPGGNIIGEAVYQRGVPCSRCLSRKCDTVRTSLCQSIDINKTDPDLEEDLVQLNIAHYTSNISNFIDNTSNNLMCLNPDNSKRYDDLHYRIR
ncbi:hypothetical protein NQ317_005423 [Molorchus minor]|uniref:SCP domain-containing protein n=1 Tax=Molorchus minor TaxID=1323400 RepID=A0ABQ9JHL6_9CUCU|nr:hypothetical protein NQ317_005423 [Molorchus minor]